MLWASKESGQGTMGVQSPDFPKSGRVSLGPSPSSPGAGGQLSYAMKYRGTAELCQIILLRSFNIYTSYRRAGKGKE